MKLCRFQPLEFAAADIARAPRESHPHVRHGIIEANTVHEFSGELWGARELTGHKWPLDSVKFLPPSIPSKIVCVGKNYVDHAAEMGGPPPKNPIIFLKPPSAIIAPEEPIILPRISQRVDYEGEIAIVIGRRCHLLDANEDVRPYILGYTCFNDVTARDLQKLDGQWTRQKLRHLLPLRPATGVRAQSCRYQSRDLRQRRSETVRQRLGNDLFG
jgi:2-keto-4-pentenoate hydratase/2-oxohepta-3-ene-1,7-dioic acid hydratase in catechol pathway